MNPETTPNNPRTLRRRLQRRRSRQQNLEPSETIPKPPAAAAPTVVAVGEDRISQLPDEIIHEILTHLQSRKQAAKAALLSSGWTRIWRTYPIVEFENEREYESAARKLRHGGLAGGGVEALRISITNRWSREAWKNCNRVRNFVADFPAKEISIRAAADLDLSYVQSISFNILMCFLHPFPAQFQGLQVLKLGGLKFNYNRERYAFAWLGTTLKVLCFEDVNFYYNDRFLNTLIADAPLLESLTLTSVRGIREVKVRNLSNLKSIQVERTDLKSFEITGTRCLEIIRISDSEIGGDLQVSSAPNIEVVQVNRTKWPVDELISKFDYVKSLMQTNPPKVCELKTDNDDMGGLMLRFSRKASGVDGLVTAVSLYCKVKNKVDVETMIKLLTNLSGFEVTLELSGEIRHENYMQSLIHYMQYYMQSLKNHIMSRGILDKMSIPNIQCLKLSSQLLASCYENDYLGSLFRICNTKLLHIIDDPNRENSYKVSRRIVYVILNKVMSDAPMLESLTLTSFKGIRKFKFRNLLNLKSLEVGSANVESFEITGSPSLEILRLYDCEIDGVLQVSSTPNLKVLQIISTSWSIDKLISKFPSVESLMLAKSTQVCELKILSDDHGELVLRFSRKTNGIDGLVTDVSMYCKLGNNANMHVLKKVIARLSRFQVTLEFSRETPHKIFQDHDRNVMSKKVMRDKMPIPTIECLKFPSSLLASCYEDALGTLFQICHPRLLHIVEEPDQRGSNKFSSLYFRSP